jgi:guanyl-specific ribonuclease Sa
MKYLNWKKSLVRNFSNGSGGYYWSSTENKSNVLPTPGVKGVGAQRIVTGKEGEVWYTLDHYETFIRVK